MDFDKVLKKRRSIRKFKKKIVSEGDVSEIVNAGNYSPSSGNIQNWEFIVVKDPDVRDKVADVCVDGSWIKKADFLVVVLNDESEVVEYYKERGKKYAIQNCAAATQNMLLKAADLGIGSCWIGAYDDKKVREILQIPEDLAIEAILAFGYAAEKGEYERDEIRMKVSFNLYGEENPDIFPLAQNPKVKKRTRFLKKS